MGQGACAATGHVVCASSQTSTTCDAQGASPVPERCDDVDNNCDGENNEGFDLGATCTVGLGICAREGVRECKADGSAGCSASPGPPSRADDPCNGVDDNCDGSVDRVGTSGASTCPSLETLITSGPQAVTSATDASAVSTPGWPTAPTTPTPTA